MYRLISFVVSVCFRRSPRASLFPYTTLFRSSAVGSDLAGEQTQQAGFAVPVASDDADPCALVDAQAHRLQHHTAGVLQMHGLRAEQMGSRPAGHTRHRASWAVLATRAPARSYSAPRASPRLSPMLAAATS